MKKHLNTALLLALALCLGAMITCALADGAPAFSVSNLTPQYNETVTVTVQAPANATAVRVWNDGEGNRQGRWDYFDRNRNLGWLQTDIMCWDAGPWRVAAEYTAAEYEGWDELTALPDSAWTAVGQEITLAVADQIGVMDPPDAHLVSDTVDRGTPIRLVIDALQGRDEWYFAELEAWDGTGWSQLENSHADFDPVAGAEQAYPTVHLTPGRYRLRLACEAVGWDQACAGDLNENDLAFTVSEPAEDPPEVALYFSSGNALSFEQITFWAWAEGADHIHITITRDGDPYWRNDRDMDGGLQCVDWSSSDSGTYIFTLTATYGGEEVEAAPFVLTQTNPYGVLEAPVINGVPRVIAVGQTVSGTLSAVQNAGNYHMRLRYRPDNEPDEEIWEFTPGGDRVFSIPGHLFSREGLYALEAHSHALGYDGGHTECMIFVAETVPQGSSFLVTQTEALTWERFSFSIYAPGMSRVMLKLNGGFWGDSDGDSLAGTCAFREPGVYTLQAIATDDPDAGWTQIGELIQITVTAPYGGLPVTLSAPANVAPDGTAEVTVTWTHGGQACDGWLGLYDQNWNEQDAALELISRDESETATTKVFRLLGDQLTEGETYLLEAGLRPDAPGYTETIVRRELAVIGGAQTAALTVQDTDLLRCEGTDVTVSVPGATALMLHIEQNRWDWIAGSECTRYYEFFNEGAAQVYARYTTEPIPLDANGDPDFDSVNWTGVTNAVTVRVTVTDRLRTPDCGLTEEIVQRGAPFLVNIHSTQGKGEWYMARLQDAQSGQPVTGISFWDEAAQTIRVDTLDVAPGLYSLSVWTDAVGCDSAGTEFFVGVDEPKQGLTVNLPASPVLSQASYPASAYAPGAARIELVITAPGTQISPRVFSAEGDTLREELVFGNSEGTRHLVFTAYDANDVTLDAYETDVAVVSPYGDRPAPRIFMSGVWTAGESMNFRVDAGDALYIYVDVVDLSAGSEVVYEDPDLRFDGWSYSVPAAAFTSGHSYRIEGFTSGIGYNAQEFAYTVNLLPANAVTLQLPAALSEIGDEAFTETAAQRITVPQTVTVIGQRAFASCAGLLVADLPAGLARLPSDAFAGSGNVTVYGPAGSALENAVKNCGNVSFICLGD